MSEPPIPIARAIRHKHSRSWFTREGGWTYNFCEALAFDSIKDALHIAQKHRLREVEFVIRFLNEPYWDIATDLYL